MKKITALLLCVAIMAAIFAACGDSRKKESAQDDNDVDGGIEPAVSPVVPDDVKALLDKALEKMTGAEYTPVAYLGSQVVAGMNHFILCRTSQATQDADEYYSIVTLYADLEGGAEITDIKGSSVSTNISEMLGSWQQSESPVIPEDVQKAFDSATETLTGASYEPIALVSTQLVSGMNYCIFCEYSTSAKDMDSGYAFVTLYVDLQGNSEITDIAAFE